MRFLNAMISALPKHTHVKTELAAIIKEPVEIWDGVHRIMSALDLDVQELPAVVGTKLN